MRKPPRFLEEDSVDPGSGWVKCVFTLQPDELVWVNLPGPLQPFILPAGQGGALILAQRLIGGVEEAQAPSLSGV